MLSGNDIPHSLPNYICISLKYSTTIFPLIKHMVLYFYDTRILPVISKIIRNICNTLTLWSTTEVLKHFSVKFLIIELQGKFNFSISIVYIEVIYDHSRWIFSISTFQIVDILPIFWSLYISKPKLADFWKEGKSRLCYRIFWMNLQKFLPNWKSMQSTVF